MGRSLRDFQPLMPGEQRLMEACRLGERAKLGVIAPEAFNNDALRVRAAFLRFLLLGGDDQTPVHEHGVQLAGAYVEGVLDLDGCRILHNVDLKYCKFTDHLRAQGMRVEGLMTLAGSHLCQGINAERLQCDGGLHLRNGFKATGAVWLLGAQIGGDLVCSGGQFEVKEGNAISADGAVVKGDVFFNDDFKATGEVRLLGAQIGGDLVCSGGQFEVKEGDALSADRAVVKGDVFFNDGFKATGEVRLLGAQIGGNLECRGGKFEVKEGDALSVQNADVKGVWFFGRPAKTKTPETPATLETPETPVLVNAEHMQVSVLVDTPESWAKGSTIDGLRYRSLGGNAPTQANARLKWLGKQPPRHRGETDKGEHFRPQPWRQLQGVLREMGHAEDAREIGIAFEQQLRNIGRIGRSPPGTWAPVAWSKCAIAYTGHALFGGLSGYGYRPMRLMAWMALVWLICALCYWRLALPPYDAIGPSDPLVFQNERYASCVPDSPTAAAATASGEQSAGNWYLCESLPAAYSTFSPLAYSLDIILPLVDLGQEKAWGSLVVTPRADGWEELRARSPGHLVRLLVWFETLFGWVGSLLLVGIVSGLARRSED